MPSIRGFGILLGGLTIAVSAAGTAVSTSNTMTTSMAGSTTVSSPSSTRSLRPVLQTITVQVGNRDHKFKPDVVKANVGDVIEFDFYPANHSVVRAEYEHPCIPYEMTGQRKEGFYSGFHPVDTVLDDPPKYTVRVNDSNPIFFYCSAPDSCQVHGMVGVINPNASTSLATQRQLALQASYQISPGEPFPSEAETPSSSTLPDGSSINSQSPSPASSHSNELSGGAIAGIVIACLSVLLLAGLLIWFWGRFKTLREEVNRKDSTVVRSTEPRDTWYLTTSPSSGRSMGHACPSPSTHPGPSPPYSQIQSPMTSHAVPSAYYEATYSRTTSPRSGAGTDRMSRASDRSVGGFFDLSPVTGHYSRAPLLQEEPSHEQYQFAPNTSDMTSLVDPNVVPRTGQLHDLQRLARSPDLDSAGGYIDEKGRVIEQHVNRGAAAEMPDASVQDSKFF